MWWRLIPIVVVIAAALCSPLHSQVSVTGAGCGTGLPPCGGVAGYTGPGDVASGAAVFYGLRAYNNTWAAGTGKLINLQRSSDSHTCDVLSTTAGAFGLTANCSTPGDNGSVVATWCTATICSLQVAYDQSGNGVDANVVKNAPTLVFSCLGSLPCVNNFSNVGLISTNTISLTQAFSASIVTNMHVVWSGGFHTVIGCGNAAGTSQVVQYGHGNQANSALNFAGTVFNYTVAPQTNDQAWHSFNFVTNGASSTTNPDGSGPSAANNAGAGNCNTAGGGQFATYANGGNGTNNTTYNMEAGIWPGTMSSTVQNNLCHNQNLFYTLGLSC